MGWGDDIMVTGQVRVMQQTDPRPVRVMYERFNRWPDTFNNNPRIARPDDIGDLQVLHPRVNYLRPYMQEKGRTQWRWKRYAPPVGELYFTAAEREFGERHAGRVIIEPTIKPGASPNKAWGWIKWNKLAWLLGRQGIKVTQLGPHGTPLLEGADLVVTPNLRMAAAVLETARGAVLPEGGLHHTAAAVDTPAVVIYGGYIGPMVTGYAKQTSFFTETAEHPIGCGMRVECPHCAAAMAAIAPDAVAKAVEAMLESDQTVAGAVAA